MRYFVLLFSLSLLSPVAFAQHFSWAKHWGNSNFEHAITPAVDADENIYVAGFFRETVDFDPGPDSVSFVSEGGMDGYVSKFDPRGNLLWARQIGGTGEDDVDELHVAADGSLYISGRFQGTVDFDSGPGTALYTASGTGSFYVAKYDTGSSPVWVNLLGVSATGFLLDTNENIYLSGRFHGTQDFDPKAGSFPLTSTAWIDGFISKWDSTGNLIWAKQIERLRHHRAPAMDIDLDGNLYISSVFDSTVDFNPGPAEDSLVSVNQENDIFVAKYDVDGNFAWVKQIRGSTQFDQAFSLVVDNAGNVYTGGVILGTADFDPGPGTNYHFVQGIAGDAYLLKLDTDGNYIWSKFIESLDAEAIQATVLADGILYNAGFFGGTVDFDPGIGIQSQTATLGGNTFVCAWDTAGTFIWANHFENRPWEFYFTGLAVDADANVYASGLFSDSANFNPNGSAWPLVAAGREFNDGYLVKISSCVPDFDTQVALGCGGSYTWPLTGGTYYESGIYYQTLLGSGGCDSSVILQVNIPVLYNTVAEENGVLRANPAQTFDSHQWFNCDNNSPVPGATNPILLPPTAGSYALIAGLDGCLDTSACVLMPLGIAETETTGIHLYPNPAHDKLQIQLQGLPSVSIEVLDITGKSLYNFQNVSNGTLLPVQDWKPGLYLIKTTGDGQTQVHRIIKN